MPENVNDVNDGHLIDRFLDGDRDAFNRLVIKWQDPVHRFAYRYFADREEAMEITQKTFIRVYHKLHSLADREKFPAWIFRIASNLCIDESRRSGRRKETELNGRECGELPDIQATPSMNMEKSELGVLVEQALLLIPDEQRTVIILKEYQGLTFREIADILEQPESTVKFRMYYGLKSLRKVFNKWNIDKEALL